MSMPSNFPRTHEFRNEESSNTPLRLRFDDFTFESRISGPTSQSRPPLHRSRASWAFPLRRGPSSGSDPTLDPTITRSTVSAGEVPCDPPPWGIMKTIEFQLSYEARTWTSRGKATRKEQSTILRPSTVAEMRRVSSGEVPLRHDSGSPTSLDFDDEVAYPGPPFRLSSPPATPWEWVGNRHGRPILIDGVGLSPPRPTRTIEHDKRQSTHA